MRVLEPELRQLAYPIMSVHSKSLQYHQFPVILRELARVLEGNYMFRRGGPVEEVGHVLGHL